MYLPALSVVFLALAILPASASEADVKAVKAVLSAYKSAVESLDASGAVQLFAEDSAVFENGTAEGTFSHYLGHHLGPELREVRAFRYSDHSVNVKVEGAMAVASETYRFRMEPKHGEAIERQAVATSALRKEGEAWKILQYHNSSRRSRGS
jgi:ketosteroid isomerase-like protein